MHTRASNSELVEPLLEPERTLNRRRRRRNRRVPFDQRNNPPKNPRIVYPPILDINHFRHFLVTLENLYPMDDEPMWAADRVVAPTPGSAITIPETANEFAIKGNHLTLVKGNQFDGRTKTDPHKHIHEFLRICDMFKYRDTKNEAVRLMMFPLSLTREAKTWLDELNEGTIETWDELRTTFISRFFPPALFNRILGEIQAFSQHENESLTEAWLRMKEMLRNCHGHNLPKATLSKSSIMAYQLLEDKVILQLDWDKKGYRRPPVVGSIGRKRRDEVWAVANVTAGLEQGDSTSESPQDGLRGSRRKALKKRYALPQKTPRTQKTRTPKRSWNPRTNIVKMKTGSDLMTLKIFKFGGTMKTGHTRCGLPHGIPVSRKPRNWFSKLPASSIDGFEELRRDSV
ncbi:reverse transcriptase domain-containing protein [Tanacetum coccineum]